MNIIEHVEGFLGPVIKGWRLSSLADASIGVAQLDVPFLPGIDVLVTLGMSHHILQRSSKGTVRIEFIFALKEGKGQLHGVNLLGAVCEKTLESHSAVSRGQLVTLSEFEGLPMVASLYCASPVFADDAVSTFFGTTPPTVMVWLVPLLQPEHGFVQRSGWNSFESLLEDHQVDPLTLMDLEREPVVVG